MKNSLFKMKSVIKGTYKAIVGAGAETKSFGSTTLVISLRLLFIGLPYCYGFSTITNPIWIN
jgi:hypothetical protein